MQCDDQLLILLSYRKSHLRGPGTQYGISDLYKHRLVSRGKRDRIAFHTLKTWHASKDSFIQMGVHNDLNTPKFHSLQHYIESIRFFGTTDNYNTEMFERLHIDFAKKGWRASNKRDEFPQMTRWLSRQENIHSFNRELSWILEQQSLANVQMPLSPASPLAVPTAPAAYPSPQSPYISQ